MKIAPTTHTSTPAAARLLRLGDIVGTKPSHGRPGRVALVPISAATFLRLVRRGDAPRPVRISTGTVCWLETEIAAWISARAAARGAATAEAAA